MLRKKAPKPKAPDLRIFVKEQPKVPFEAAQGGHQQYDDVTQISPHQRDATVQIVNPQSQQIVTGDGTTNTNAAIDQIWFQLNLSRGGGSFHQNVGTTPIIVTWSLDCVYILFINDDPNNSIFIAIAAPTVTPSVNQNTLQASMEIKPKESQRFWVHTTSFAIVASGANTPVRAWVATQAATP